MEEEIDFEKIPGTWAYILKRHWLAFNQCLENLNSDGKFDKFKFREYVLWNMQRRHKKEIEEEIKTRRKTGSEDSARSI